jgi:hypothetical protein
LRGVALELLVLVDPPQVQGGHEDDAVEIRLALEPVGASQIGTRLGRLRSLSSIA